MIPAASPSASASLSGLASRGFAFVSGIDMRRVLASSGEDALSDFEEFAASWGDLHVDQYMADGGRYRRRRHALFEVPRSGTIERKPHGPHFQGLEYNPLNGGIARWFEPITRAVGQSRTLGTILSFCQATFSGLSPSVARWNVEAHQFRIEASTDELARPTPEGIHRDGVDWVLVLLVRRENIASGTTTIHAPDGETLGSFTLTAPFDAALIDDRERWHGVTPVEPVDTSRPAFRDVLVVTFREASAHA